MAMHKFTFKGGVATDHARHITEKFLLFLIVGGKESPLYEMTKLGLVEGIEKEIMAKPGRASPRSWPSAADRFVVMAEREYSTALMYGKLFVAQQGFGIQKRYHSFYFQFMPETTPATSIYSFSYTASSMVFKSRIRLLKKEETLALIEDPLSKTFIEKQGILPQHTLERMVVVEQEQRRGMRMIRVGGK